VLGELQDNNVTWWTPNISFYPQTAT